MGQWLSREPADYAALHRFEFKELQWTEKRKLTGSIKASKFGDWEGSHFGVEGYVEPGRRRRIVFPTKDDHLDELKKLIESRAGSRPFANSEEEDLLRLKYNRTVRALSRKSFVLRNRMTYLLEARAAGIPIKDNIMFLKLVINSLSTEFEEFFTDSCYAVDKHVQQRKKYALDAFDSLKDLEKEVDRDEKSDAKDFEEATDKAEIVIQQIEELFNQYNRTWKSVLLDMKPKRIDTTLWCGEVSLDVPGIPHRPPVFLVVAEHHLEERKRPTKSSKTAPVKNEDVETVPSSLAGTSRTPIAIFVEADPETTYF